MSLTTDTLQYEFFRNEQYLLYRDRTIQIDHLVVHSLSGHFPVKRTCSANENHNHSYSPLQEHPAELYNQDPEYWCISFKICPYAITCSFSISSRMELHNLHYTIVESTSLSLMPKIKCNFFYIHLIKRLNKISFDFSDTTATLGFSWLAGACPIRAHCQL